MYVCPYSEKRNQYPFLICQKQMEDGKDYNIRENAFAAYCIHQHHCRCVNGVANTEEARNCEVKK